VLLPVVSHRRSSPSGLGRSARGGVVAAVSVVAATAAATLVAAPAGAEPRESADATRTKVDRLYEDAEKATEQYNKADEKVAKLRKLIDHAQDRAARGQDRINRMRGALGSAAGAQYRSGGIDPGLALLLSSTPDTYLDRATALGRVSAHQAGVLRELRRAQRQMGQERTEANHDLTELERSRAAVASHKRTVEHKLAQARRLLSALPDGDRASYDRSSRSGGRDAAPVPSGGEAAPASGRAEAAMAAARRAVGLPYVWGANGPSGFDCSGLTQWAYAQAGVGLPRTSQAQRYAGHQVPLSQARPGDLVAYRDDASHIAMYAGNGQVIHAPYPGAAVRYDPVGMMPVSSVTRV
jgi:cell wall-associated NlpC family hydrolase